MTDKGIAHIGIGEAKGDDKALEAVQQAVSSPLLETTIEGASHVIINISGDISLMDANDAASYVQNLAGEDANIIFGAMYDDSVTDTAKITVIATGLNDATAKQGKRIPQRAGRCKKERIFQQQLLCTGSRSGTHCSESFRSGTAAATGSGAAAGTGSADHDKQCSEKGHPDPGFLKKPQISKE